MQYKEIAKEKYNVYYTMYNDEEILVGNIYMINNVYAYSDVMFDNVNPINNESCLDDLKEEISKYYSSKDTIGKIEEKYPELF